MWMLSSKIDTFISITVNPLNMQCVMCPKSDNRRKGGCILTEWWFDLFSSHHVWCGYICSNALLPPPHDPTPICAPWGCMHHSSLSVYPRQQSSEHLATVTQQHAHKTNWLLSMSGQCSLHFNFLQNPTKLSYATAPQGPSRSHQVEWGSTEPLHICQSAPLPWSEPSLQSSTVSQFWWNSPILELTIQSLHCDILYNLVPYKFPVRTLYTNLGWLLHPKFSWNHHIHSIC